MIKGITGQLAEAGKIKIGKKGDQRKSTSGTVWRPPIKLDHFLITGNVRGDDENLIVNQALMGAIEPDEDGELRAIPVMLHADTIDEVFPTRYALYVGKSCACSGDGERATRTHKDGVVKEIRCPCEYLLEPLGCGNPMQPPKFQCKPNGKLLCSIVAPGQALAGAIHTWRTTSEISIRRMYGSLEQILAVVGALRGVPLWLKLEPVKVNPPAGKPATVYCCHVELRETDIAAVQARALKAAERRRALGGGDGYRALLTAPAVGESLEEQAEVAEEFYPEAAPEDVTGPIGGQSDNAGDALADRIANNDGPPHDPNTGEVHEPDAKKSGKLTGEIVGVISKAGSLEEMGQIKEGVRRRLDDLTTTDQKIIDRELGTRTDQLRTPDDGIPDFGGPES